MRIPLRLLVLTAAAGLAGCDEDPGPGADFAFEDQDENPFVDFDEEEVGQEDTAFFQDDDPTNEFGFDTGVFNGDDDPSFGFGGSPEGQGFGNDFVDDAPFNYDTGVFTDDPGAGGDPLQDGAFGRP